MLPLTPPSAVMVGGFFDTTPGVGGGSSCWFPAPVSGSGGFGGLVLLFFCPVVPASVGPKGGKLELLSEFGASSDGTQRPL